VRDGTYELLAAEERRRSIDVGGSVLGKSAAAGIALPPPE
jgi:hypothetical protein